MDRDFGNWLAGFIDGEGCFQIQRNKRGSRWCSFVVQLRADDAAILYESQQRTGLGNVTISHPPSQRTPRVNWQITSKSECLELVKILEEHPLRAKKKRDFELWSQGVRLWQDMVYTGPSSKVKNDWTGFDMIVDAIKTGRVFDPDSAVM